MNGNGDCRSLWAGPASAPGSVRDRWRCIVALPVACWGLSFALLVSMAASAKDSDDHPVLKWSGEGFRLEMQALAHDRVLAFFVGRGFPASEARYLAQTGCVFRSAMGNAGSQERDPAITIPLSAWRTIVDGKQRPPRVREEWAPIWKERGAKTAAMVAFHWALYPTEQTYQPTDYNWGMITFALPPGTRFDLDVRWRVGADEHRKRFEGLQCAT